MVNTLRLVIGAVVNLEMWTMLLLNMFVLACIIKSKNKSFCLHRLRDGDHTMGLESDSKKDCVRFSSFNFGLISASSNLNKLHI